MVKLRADTQRIGGNLDYLGHHSLEAAGERQDQCTVKHQWIEDAFKRPYFNCTSWPALD